MAIKIFQPYIPGPEPKTLYHDEDSRKNLYDRINLFQGFPEKIKVQARSVACLVPVDNLKQEGSTYRINTERVRTLKQFVVNGEENPLTGRPKMFVGTFKTEPVLGRGTAFLVTKTHILTAGHCFYKIDQETKKYAIDEGGNYIVDETLVKTTLVVFGFALEYEKWKTEEISLSRVFKIRHITQIALTPGEGDWALVKLKRSPKDISPLELDFNNMIHDPILIYMLGHPSGLPLKYTQDGKTVKKESDTHFEAKIDAFHGNSGSPVFNKAGKVIGMLTSGDPIDYDRYYDRVVPHRADPKYIKIFGYEKCQRMTALPEDLRIRIGELDPEKYLPQAKVIEDLGRADQLIQNGNLQDVVLILQFLAQRGVQIANCALAKLAPSDAEKEAYKHAAEESGFFNSDTLLKIFKQLIEETRQTNRGNQYGDHNAQFIGSTFNGTVNFGTNPKN